MYYGEGLTPINRKEKSFACPICHKNNSKRRKFFTNLKRLGLNASLAKKRKPNKLTSINKLGSNNKHRVDEKEADEVTDQHSVGEEETDDEKTSKVGITHIPPSSLVLKVPSTTKLLRLTHRDVILTSIDSLTADEATQEDKMTLTRLGRWVSVGYNHDNMQYGTLTPLK
ncbi:hypothetical protein [Parasitella parasitica]|uniref:Uncharacterized protein n=1 Tax=Parasitella parasitica TaxID=35722 RepID=A0A0B7MR88_9FUNG|nr:hypothetical protein [Parasitella parasitica]